MFLPPPGLSPEQIKDLYIKNPNFEFKEYPKMVGDVIVKSREEENALVGRKEPSFEHQDYPKVVGRVIVKNKEEEQAQRKLKPEPKPKLNFDLDSLLDTAKGGGCINCE
jgi:hypothetical protein